MPSLKDFDFICWGLITGLILCMLSLVALIHKVDDINKQLDALTQEERDDDRGYDILEQQSDFYHQRLDKLVMVKKK